MIAIADQSALPVWSPWVWVVAMALVIAAQLILIDLHAARRRPTKRPVTLQHNHRRCWAHQCPYPGRVRVLTAHDNLPVWVCQGHAAEGTVRGYWRRAA